MDFNRKFQHKVDQRVVDFDVTYNPETHLFKVYESGQSAGYYLGYNVQSREWKTADGPLPSIPASELAILVQREFGHFV